MNLADISKLGVANPFKRRYDNYIGGKFVAPIKGEYFGNIKPITGQVFCGIAGSSSKTEQARRQLFRSGTAGTRCTPVCGLI